jgi:hypothetical protein
MLSDRILQPERLVLLALLCAGPTSLVGQQGATPLRSAERFSPLNWLVGEWRGFGKFDKTANYIHKKFSYDVGGMYLTERTLDVFPPAEPSTEFELHQDLIIYYREGADGPFRAKGFYVESFVASMNLTVDDGGDSITVESAQIENAPPGTRTRTTYKRQSADEFRGTFEMAKPGEPYRVVEQLTMKRIC